MYPMLGITGLLLLTSMSAVHALGCFVSDDLGHADCELYLHPWCGAPAACLPSENKNSVDERCGVFVSNSLGDDANPGGRDKPLKTIGAAIRTAGVTRIYACAEVFHEAITVPAGITLYGGLDCRNGWTYVGKMKKSTLAAAPEAIALTVASTASGTEVVDFGLQAADAVQNSGSSVAVTVNHAAIRFTRTDIVAGAGRDGMPGLTPTGFIGPLDQNDSIIRGNHGLKACSDPVQQFGADPKENPYCPTASGGPLGGRGGQSGVFSGGSGSSTPATPQTALGGIGQPSWDPMKCPCGKRAWACAGRPTGQVGRRWMRAVA